MQEAVGRQVAQAFASEGGRLFAASTVPPGWRWAVRFDAPQAPPPHSVIGPQQDLVRILGDV